MAGLESHDWQPLNPSLSANLSDSRRQLHHAAQLATAFGISYLEKKPDDSHTNLEWLESDGSLASNASNGTRVALRVRDLTLMIGDETLPLRGKTIDEAAEWIRGVLGKRGFDGERYTLKRHYEIPSHAVATGANFDAKDADLEQFSNWYSNAAAALEKIRADEKGSEVRCWPHHFDIATLIDVAPGATVGAGLEPGDVYYDQPYFYVNMNPIPSRTTLPPTLGGDGRWHTHEWIGAVLPASRLTADVSKQKKQVSDFLGSSVDTCVRLVTPQ